MTRTEALVQREPALVRIIETIEGVGTLPTLPIVAVHAMRLARDENSSMRQIAEVISQDQALAAKVLKVVNSAYYGLRERVGTLSLALTILGVREVSNLVLGIAVLSAFPSSTGNKLFSQESLWRASAKCAYIARKLSRGVGLGRFGSEAFLGALVRDIGVIVLHNYFHDEFMAMLRAAHATRLDPIEAEVSHLGVTHASVGAWLAERWAFPATLVDTIAFHHRPGQSSWEPPLAALAYLAGLILEQHDAGASVDQAAAALEADSTWRRLIASGPPARPPSSVAGLLEDVVEEVEAATLIVG